MPPMFAIIDIETTGTTPGHDRITDICILIHDGLSVVDKFSTLIHPERRIPDFITRLTGIDDEMVARAPKFYEVARKVVEMTEGMIFVAHNVDFDYNFVANEFKSLGYKYKRDKLCTVRLSRKLLPGHRSYSLGRLCDNLGITIENRHRAEGDAVATAQLFDLLLKKKNESGFFAKQDLQQISARRIDNVKASLIKKLPEVTGVYFFLDKDNQIIYIGKSKNIRERAFGHFNTKTKKAGLMIGELYDVDYLPTGSELIALLIESEQIKKHKPKYNRLRKQSVFTHAIDWSKNEKGILELRIVPFDESEQPLQAFGNAFTARDRLNAWIDEADLCLSYCGIYDLEGPCFNRQIHRCNGICCGEEDAKAYNRRAKKIIDQFRLPEEDLLILDKGRDDEEQSVILVRNGRYAGYAWLDSSQQISSISELKELIAPGQYFPDMADIVRGYLRQNRNAKVIKSGKETVYEGD